MGRNFKVETVHKYMYPATYNWKADIVGAVPDGWTDNSGGTCTPYIISSLDGHNKVLELDVVSANEAWLFQAFDAETSGAVEAWIRTTNVTKRSRVLFLSENSINTAQIYIDSSKIRIHNGGFIDCLDPMVNDTWYHIKITFECGAGGYDGLAADTFNVYIDGVETNSDIAFTNVRDQVTRIEFRAGDGAATGYQTYIDAWGVSWDTDYAIGDNVFWRHYFDQDSDFESEDVGTTSTSIGFVDTDSSGANGVVEIIEEFNEHKKILKLTADVGGDDANIQNDFASAQTSGTYEFFIKSDDVTQNSQTALKDGATTAIQLYLGGEKLKHAGGDIADVIDDTWYHIRVEFECGATAYKGLAADTFYIWLNNIRYGAYAFSNAVADVDRIQLYATSAAAYSEYIDAFSYSWTTGNSVADNRTFDYNSTYTKTDITTDVSNVLYSNKLHAWRTATLYSEKAYYYDEVFFLVYDINSKLALEADLTNRIQNGAEYQYPLMDKNADDLVDEKSNTFTADDIHDPTDSTSMLKVILPNVSEADGDLILVNADTKTDTYSPVTKNYPNYMMLRDISDIADSVVIIEPNGKCHLDDDLASGDSLDLDTTADKNMMIREPIVNDVIGINYYVIKGAINPDTGARFYKVVDNAGDDKKNTFRIINNQLENQTDLDAYAAKLAAQLISVKEITIGTQGLGTHNMGETFNYKYVNAVFNIPQKDYYIISEGMDFDLAVSTIILSEGIVESSKYAQTFEKPENYTNSLASEIYRTDIITVYPESYPYGGAGKGDGPYITANAIGEGITLYFPIPAQVDDSRNAFFHFYWQRGDANNDTVACFLYASSIKTDGSEVLSNNVENGTGINLPASVVGARYQTYVYTLNAADFAAGDFVSFSIDMRETRTLYLMQPAVVFYLKRSV